MNFAMKLHYQLLAAESDALPVLLIHGLFGNLDNLGVLARDLHKQHTVIKVDLRNHGLSPRADDMNYPAMAQDLLALLDELQLEKAIVIGHSMGGKAAMALTAIAPERVAADRHRRRAGGLPDPPSRRDLRRAEGRQRRRHHPAPRPPS